MQREITELTNSSVWYKSIHVLLVVALTVGKISGPNRNRRNPVQNQASGWVVVGQRVDYSVSLGLQRAGSVHEKKW